MFVALTAESRAKGCPIYLVIDEYDNFTNALIRSAGNESYRSIKPWYDGYCFARGKVGQESVFNSDMALFHLKSLVAKGVQPENMVDANIATDYDKLETIVDLQRQAGASDAEDVSPLTEELAATGEIALDLVDSFPADAIVRTENFRSLFHYYGILSMAGRKKGMTYFRIPNACVEKQLFNYLRDSYRRARLPDWIGWSKLASAMAYDGDWEPFFRRLASDFAETTPIRGDISGEIRVQGYIQAEFGHVKFCLAKPEMELSRGYCDFCLFPERVYYGDVGHSYIVELKYSKPEAGDADLAAKAEDGIAKLRRYAADPFVPELAKDTALHLVLFQFKGTELVRLEEIPRRRQRQGRSVAVIQRHEKSLSHADPCGGRRRLPSSGRRRSRDTSSATTRRIRLPRMRRGSGA